MAFAVATNHRLAGRRDVCFEELAGERLIVPAQSAVSAVFERAYRQRGMQPPVQLHISDQQLLLQLAAMGIGVGLSGRVRIEESGLALWAVEPIDERMEFAATVVWAERALRNHAVQGLVNVAKDWVASTDSTPRDPGFMRDDAGRRRESGC